MWFRMRQYLEESILDCPGGVLVPSSCCSLAGLLGSPGGLLLGGSWVVISRVISRATILITHIRGLITPT